MFDLTYEELLPAVEGICPVDGHNLDRSEMSSGKPVGVCPACGLGWSAEGDSVTVHFHVDVPNPLYVGPLGDEWTATLTTTP